MEQKAIGIFIAELRKDKSFTQAELGKRLGVTNKTVSRWENGNYMPDLSVLPALCSELGIGINELLSGQRLEDPEFRAQADSNLMFTMRQQKALIQQKKWSGRLAGMGVGLLIGTAYAPDSWKKTISFIAAIVLIAVGECLRRKVDRTYGINF